MIVEEIEAKPFHCGQMARLLRAEHKAILARVDLSIHRQLREYFDFSVLRQAWKIDGKLVAMAGVLGTLGSRETIWLALTDEATKHPLVVARRADRYVDKIMRHSSRLSCEVLAADKKALDFARFLGFVTVHKHEIMGIATVHMSRINMAKVA